MKYICGILLLLSISSLPMAFIYMLLCIPIICNFPVWDGLSWLGRVLPFILGLDLGVTVNSVYGTVLKDSKFSNLTLAKYQVSLNYRPKH